MMNIFNTYTYSTSGFSKKDNERTYRTSVASVSRKTNTSKRVDPVHTDCPILAWVWATVVDI